MFQDILILRQHPLFHSHCIIYLLIPTSNHNDFVLVSAHGMLYIFWFLHQTTTGESDTSCLLRCISFDSYIKPQRAADWSQPWWVVYLLIPTSNHNAFECAQVDPKVVYLLIPTSNHNYTKNEGGNCQLYIFWFLHQTTTESLSGLFSELLYIFWFLHQTTTSAICTRNLLSCISFDSYIKPQPFVSLGVVPRCCISFDSYIKPQQSLWFCVC